MKNEKPEHRVADALRKVARRLDEQLGEGHRSRKIDAEDLLETLLAVADDLDPPLPKAKRRRTRPKD
jgi:hypothetical protein